MDSSFQFHWLNRKRQVFRKYWNKKHIFIKLMFLKGLFACAILVVISRGIFSFCSECMIPHPNISNYSTRSHPSKGDNHTKNHNKNCTVLHISHHCQKYSITLSELQYNSLSMLVKVYARIRSFIVTCVLCFGQIRQYQLLNYPIVQVADG